MKVKTRAERHHEAKERLRKSGYGSDAAQDKAMITKAVHEHERHDHKGEPLTKLKLRNGGAVQGVHPAYRLDRKARGGAAKHKGHAKINVIVQAGGGDAEKQMAAQQGMQQGIRMGQAMGARAAAAHMAGPPQGGPPPGAMPSRLPMAGAPQGAPVGAGAPPGMPPRPPMNRGGKVAYPHPNAGGGGAKGRLEKAESYGNTHVKVREHLRRRSGGRAEC